MNTALKNTEYVLPVSVEEVLATYWDKTLPINPIKIAQAMSVNVLQAPTLNVDGAFFYAPGTSTPTIVYRPSGHSRRDRFTIAHELGHFCSGHSTSLRDGTVEYNQYNYDPLETSANTFAAELLMPYGLVTDAIYNKGITTLESLSDYFDVSITAMNIRLTRMGII